MSLLSDFLLKQGIACAAVTPEDYRGDHKAPGPDYGAPMYDLSEMYPRDVYTGRGYEYTSSPEERAGLADVFRVHNKPWAPITIYRAVPKDVIGAKINVGDWVTTSRAYAKEHGEAHLGGKGTYKILKLIAHARDLYTAGDSLAEWGYYPREATEEEKQQVKDIRDRGSRERTQRVANGEKLAGLNKYPEDPYFDKPVEFFQQLLDDKSATATIASVEIPDTIIINGVSRPTHNSDGKLIYPTVEGIENFWDWFGDSKVIDNYNRPIVCYHGTSRSFSKFDKHMHGGFGGVLGHWFSDKSAATESFSAIQRENSTGPNTMPCYLRIVHPEYDNAWEGHIVRMNQIKATSIESRYKWLRSSLLRKHCDGLVIKNSTTDGGIKRNDFVVLNNNQIKSAVGNNGIFSKETPVITASEAMPDTILVDGVSRLTHNSNGDLIHSTVQGIENFWRWFGTSKVVDASGHPSVVYHGVGSAGKFNKFRKDLIGASSGNEGHFGKGFYFSPDKKEAKTFSEQWHGTGDVLECYLRITKPFEPTTESLWSIGKKNPHLNVPDKIPVAIDGDDVENQLMLTNPKAGRIFHILRTHPDDAWAIITKDTNGKMPSEPSAKILDILNDTREYLEPEGNRSVPEDIVRDLKSLGITPKLVYGHEHELYMPYLTDVGERGASWTKALQAEGYDGVLGPEIVVFDESQIKSVDNTGAFDPKTTDITAATDYHDDTDYQNDHQFLTKLGLIFGQPQAFDEGIKVTYAGRELEIKEAPFETKTSEGKPASRGRKAVKPTYNYVPGILITNRHTGVSHSERKEDAEKWLRGLKAYWDHKTNAVRKS